MSDTIEDTGVYYDFRCRCEVCGLQIQYEGGQRVQPDCGHPVSAIGIDL